PRGGMMIMVDDSGAHLKAPAANLGNLSEMLSRFSDKPVVDYTGIEGAYEFDLVFSPEVIQNRGGGRPPMPMGDGGGGSADGPGSAAGSIYDSVGRYGLKLESRKAPLDKVIVDKVEGKPTEN